MQVKLCHSCFKEKPVSEFWRNGSKGDGYYYICKECGTKARREKITRVRTGEWQLPPEIIEGIHRAVARCNKFLKTTDIVCEILEVPVSNRKFWDRGTEEKRLLSRRITEYMKPRYQIYSENSKGITWLVK